MPSSFDGARAALATLFKTGWGTRTPVQWPGQRFQRPENEADFVRFNDRPEPAEKISAGQEGGAVPVLYRHHGMLFIEIMTYGDAAGGDGAARRHADFAAGIFRGAGGAIGFRFGAPSLDVVGWTPEGWWKENLAIPYQWDASY